MQKTIFRYSLLAVGLLLTNFVAQAGEDLKQIVSPTPSVQGDGSSDRKFYTLSASLREEYDDNVFTQKDNKTDSFVTQFSPSILVDFPMDNSEFSARYTFGLDYYENRPGNQFDFTHSLLVRYDHAFSDRFNLDVRDQAGYFTQPSVLDAIGTVNRNGSYVSNIATVEFTAQWTPLIGTVTSYSNSFVNYENSEVGFEQNSEENSIAQDIRFAILPNYNLIFGGIYDNLDYDQINRGYTNYTGNVGIDWQASPTLSLGGRVGATYTTPVNGKDVASPYGSVTANWKLGSHSTLVFNYLHNVVPSDVITAQGQEADRFTANFIYNFTPSLTGHFQGIYTHSNYTSELLAPGTIGDFNEDIVAFDTGLDYHFNNYLDFDAGYIFTNVSSGLDFRDYTRNQLYVGVRGTY